MFAVHVIYVNGNGDLWDVRETLETAQTLATSLTTDSRHERVAESSIYPHDEPNAPELDTPEWWRSCHFMREGAKVKREW